MLIVVGTLPRRDPHMPMMQQLADFSAGAIQKITRTINPEPWINLERSLEAMNDFSRELIRAIAVERVRLLPYSDVFGGGDGETVAMQNAYDSLMKEACCKAAIYQLFLPVCFLNLEMEPASDDPIDKEAADFCRDNVLRSRGGLPHLIESTLLPAGVKGWSLAEKIDMKQERGRWKGRTMLREVKSKSHRHYDLEIDQYLNVVAVISRLDPGKNWPTSRFIIHRNMAMYENPKGCSEFKAVYRAAWMLDTVWKLRMAGLERYALPFFKGTYPLGNTTIRSAMATSLKNARGDGFALFPSGAMVEAMDIAGKSQTDFAAAIDHLRQEIFLGVNLAYLQSVEGSQPDARGDTSISKQVTELRIWRAAADGENIINDQINPRYMELNYPGRDYPRAHFAGVNEADALKEMEKYEKMLQMKFPVSMKSFINATRSQPATSDDDNMLLIQQKYAQPPQQPGGGMDGLMNTAGQLDQTEGLSDVSIMTQKPTLLDLSLIHI
jgi:hypothetical protein